MDKQEFEARFNEMFDDQCFHDTDWSEIEPVWWHECDIEGEYFNEYTP